MKRDAIKIVAYCGFGEAPVMWRQDETLDDAVNRAVRRLYLDRGALVSGDWRIVGTDTKAVEIEAPVRAKNWSELGVIRCRLDRQDGSLVRWFRRVG